MNISKWIILFSLCLLVFLNVLEARVVSSCNSGQFPCSDGTKCIPKNFHCDNETDCQDGSDEVGCSRFYFMNFSIFYSFFLSIYSFYFQKIFFSNRNEKRFCSFFYSFSSLLFLNFLLLLFLFLLLLFSSLFASLLFCHFTIEKNSFVFSLYPKLHLRLLYHHKVWMSPKVLI